MDNSRTDRRSFLRGGSALLGGLAATPFQALFARQAEGAPTRAAVSPYGPLAPVADQNTGLKLIHLPEGFSYTTFGWTGDPLSDGTPTPGVHDGMAVIHSAGPLVVLSRNHEIRGKGAALPAPGLVYDPLARGGCTNLLYHTGLGEVLKSWISIAGTSTNCAGGLTPWGTWLTCEETVEDSLIGGFAKTHGWTFEVPAFGKADPEPLKAMGRFVKEAVAVDPKTGLIYETEDRGTSGFYRYADDGLKKYNPHAKGVGQGLSPLTGTGKLEMLKVKGATADLRGNIAVGSLYDVEWVPIADPERAHSPGTSDTLGVFKQGRALGGAQFARLEGVWYGNGLFYFTATSGGAAGKGQVWAFDPATQTLELLYASPNAATLDNPDNIAVSPRGGVLLCEDGSLDGQRLQYLDASGMLYPFAKNDVLLNGEKNGIVGDFTGSEWAGATFDGEWLFANLQSPGITFAITGPWDKGTL